MNEPQKVPTWRISIRFSANDPKYPGGEWSTTWTAAEPPGVWENVNTALTRMAGAAPISPEYRPVQYTLLMWDGMTIEGAVGLQRHHHETRISLAQNLLLSLHIYAGLFKPENYSYEQYSQFLVTEDERRRSSALILDRYEFGEEFKRPAKLNRLDLADGVGGQSEAEVAPAILRYLEGGTG